MYFMVFRQIEYALQGKKRRANLTTDDIPSLAQTHGWIQPSDVGAIQWDKNALDRINTVIDQSGEYV